MKTLSIILSVAFSLVICASGQNISKYSKFNWIEIKIETISAAKNGEYRMEYAIQKHPDGSEFENGPERAVINLRYNKKLFGDGKHGASLLTFNESIAILKERAKKKELVLFGTHAHVIDEKKNELQSDALKLMRLGTGEIVIFSFAINP